MIQVLRKVYEVIHPIPVSPKFSTPASRQEADTAVVEAEKSLSEIQNNKEVVMAKVTALRIQRERNHFAELIEVTMRGTG